MFKQVNNKVFAYTDGGRRIRIRYDNAAVFGVVVLYVYQKIAVNRLCFVGNFQQFAPNRVKTVSYIGVEYRLIRVEKRPERRSQHIVRSVAAEHILRLKTIPFSQCRLKGHCISRRILFQVENILFRQHLSHRRRRRIGVLVGIQLDDILIFRLFARHIRLNIYQIFSPEFFRHFVTLLTFKIADIAW